MSDSAELYPCGVRVRIPSLGLNSATTPTGIEKRIQYSPRKNDHFNGPVFSKRTCVSDTLNMQLTFTDDAIETICPETVTYCKAKESITNFWRINSRAKKHPAATKRRIRTEPKEKSVSTLCKAPSKKLTKKITFSLDEPKFLPVLQTVFPKPLSEWTQTRPQKSTANDNRAINRTSRGSRRWTAPPIRAPTPTELQWRVQPIDVSRDEDDSLQSLLLSGDEKRARPENPQITRLLRVFQNLMSTWKIFVQPDDLNEFTSLKCLSSPCSSKQMYGLAIVCRLISKRASASTPEEYRVNNALKLIEGLLEAEASRVRVAAAVLLSCCHRNECMTNDKINQTLLSALISTSYSEKWAAAQALGTTGTCSMGVVNILFVHLCGTGSEQERENVSTLLLELSANSKLVVSLLAEKLNSKCWKERYFSCSLLSGLQHPLNKDVSSRLLHSALHDWNSRVRLIAAQVLGKTGNGKMIHDAVKQDLLDTDKATRYNALKRIHALHFMTATLLPVFVQSFKDDYDSIKLEAISIAEDLELVDDNVMSAITLLLQDDCWQVKAHAIKAVGTLKITSKAVVSHLLWAARFEQLPAVRAQVCNTLAVVGGVKDQRVVPALKELLNVEDDELVLKEARKSLGMLGQDTNAVDGMLNIVCAEVKSLSTKEAITRQILSSDRDKLIDYYVQTKMNEIK